jgi:5'(3')-deoxyribonucleotidase
LAEHYDIYILSTAPWHNPSAWSDKVVWVQRYLGDVAYKRLILSHHKDLCEGDYLIDDRTKHGAAEFGGEHIHFRTERFPDWQSVLDYLL